MQSTRQPLQVCTDIRAVFNWVSKVISRLLWFCFTALCDWSPKSRHFLNQWEAKAKPIVPRSHAFSRAWRRLHVFASSSDWSIVLFKSVVIGRSNYFGFGLTTNRSIKQRSRSSALTIADQKISKDIFSYRFSQHNSFPEWNHFCFMTWNFNLSRYLQRKVCLNDEQSQQWTARWKGLRRCSLADKGLFSWTPTEREA